MDIVVVNILLTFAVVICLLGILAELMKLQHIVEAPLRSSSKASYSNVSAPQQANSEASSAYDEDDAFIRRIEALKEELAKRPAYSGTTAEILHPAIENLPHESVKTKYDLYPEMEVAE